MRHEADIAADPSSVASAAALLELFCSRSTVLVARDGAPMNADDRAALIAGQLLAIATQLERVADAQENANQFAVRAWAVRS